MTAKIITLSNVRRSSIVCQETGVVFPQVYRLTGNVWEFKDGRNPEGCMIKDWDEIQPSEEKAFPSYTLEHGREYSKLSTPRWEPITHLDPIIDTGWLIVRYHASREAAEGYVDAMIDTNPHDTSIERWGTFQTEFGLFSILHRQAAKQTRDCLLVFTTKAPHPLGPVDWFHVIGPDREVLDGDALYPDDDVEYMKPLVDILNEEDY